MANYQVHNCDAWKFIAKLPDGAVNSIISDPLYDTEINMAELRRVSTGNILLFCAPENQYFQPDEYLFWIKTPSTKNYTKRCGRFVEMILVSRGGPFNLLHWSQMTGVYDDRHIFPPTHPYEKPLSLMERLVRIYTNTGDTVLDPFMGSGSTLKACGNLKRNAIGCEIDADVFSVTSQSVRLYF